MAAVAMQDMVTTLIFHADLACTEGALEDALATAIVHTVARLLEK